MHMALADKYGDVLALALKIGVKGGNWKEEGGKIKMWGTTPYQLEANLLWDKIKEHQGWENEVVADLKAEKADIYGIYEIKPGDTLSKVAKHFLGDSNRYMDIFNINKDQLKDPNMIKVGQQLKIPNR
jgi:LysM repeat protein